MNSIKQRCRPKHQVLVLKCFPRYTKSNPDVKPNSSELSYLLYYASTRRSKLQKVGDFLEKRTISDVWKSRIGYVARFLDWCLVLVGKFLGGGLSLFRGDFLRAVGIGTLQLSVASRLYFSEGYLFKRQRATW